MNPESETAMSQPTLETLEQKLIDRQNEMIDLQRLLTAIPALDPTSDGQGELEKCLALEDWIRERGIHDLQRFDAPDSRVDCGFRPNLVATIPGGDGPRLWILSHLDVVPPGDGWTADPWTVRVSDDGKAITGRGVEDNQQGLVASVFAALTLNESGLQAPGEIKLLFVADEETGSNYGLLYLTKMHPDLFRSDDIVLVPDFGSPDGSEVEVAEKSILWARFHTQGKQTHASRPAMGNNAHRAGAHLLVRLDALLHRRFDAADTLFVPPVSTFEPTLKLANVPNFNTIPPEDVIGFDCRILPEYKLEDVKRTMEETARAIEMEFGVKVTIRYSQEEQAAPPTSVDAPIVRKLQSAIAAVHGVEIKPVGIGGGTVAAGFRHLGIPAAVWGTLTESAHMADETCLVENMVRDARVMLQLMLNREE